MGKDFKKDLDDLFNRDDLLTKDVEVVSDADCVLLCDGEGILHLVANTPSVIRVSRGKHVLEFKASGGRKKTRTIEVGDTPVSLSVTGLKIESPSNTTPPASPRSSPSSNSFQDEVSKPSEESKERRLLYWVFGGLCAAILLLILLISVKNNTPSSSAPKIVPTTKPSTPVSNTDAPKNATQINSTPTGRQNSSSVKSPQNNATGTPASSTTPVDSQKSIESQSTPAKPSPRPLTLSSTDVTIVVGDTYRLSASGAKVDGWETGNPTVVTVNQNGIITAKGTGKTTVKAVSGSSVKQCNVTVNEFTLTPSTLQLGVGEQRTLSVNASVEKWESENVKVATVNSNGIVSGVGVGSTNIWAYHGSKLKRCHVTITKATSGQVQASPSTSSSDFSISPGSREAIVGDKFALSATGTVDKWESENEKVVTVSNNGVVTCVGVGKANIWAYHGGELKRCFVTVTSPTTQSSSNTSQSSPAYITVNSTVKDEKGNALVGATVVVKRTSQGAVTDIEGRFSLRAFPDAMIEISYARYKSQTFRAADIPKTIILYK